MGIGAGGALTTGDNNIDVGNAGVAGESAKIRIGTKGTHMKQRLLAAAAVLAVIVAVSITYSIRSSGQQPTVQNQRSIVNPISRPRNTISA